MNVTSKILAAAIAGAFSVSAAQAAVVNSDTGFVVFEDFESFDGLVTKGPESLGGGITFSSDVYSTIGAFAADLGDNGTWGSGNKFAGIGDLSFNPATNEGFVGSMTFQLGALSDRIGALFSTYQDSSVPGQVTIEALGVGANVLESHSFSIAFGDPALLNQGVFVGFLRASPDIAALRVSGDGFVVDNVSTVPLPATLPLLLSGLGMLAARPRRRQDA